MKMTAKHFSRAILMACVLAMPAMQGCATSSNPRVTAAVEDEPFYAWFNRLLDQVKADPNYKRMPIDTKADEEQFLIWLHDTYRHRMTKQEFAELANGRYPNHRNEVAFIVSKFP